MTRAHVLIIAICSFLTALAGFDVLASSFAAPGNSHEWGISRAALGVVLCMELLGMAIGSILAGGLSDRIGRRYAVLACPVVMALGMVLPGSAHSVYDLSSWRLFTGLGIGGILSTSNALAAGFSNLRRRAYALH
jgi:MFS family permease